MSMLSCNAIGLQATSAQQLQMPQLVASPESAVSLPIHNDCSIQTSHAGKAVPTTTELWQYTS